VIQGEKLYDCLELERAIGGLPRGNEFQGNPRIGIWVPDGPLTVAAIIWVRRQDLSSVLIPGEFPLNQAFSVARRLGCTHLLTGRVEGQSLELLVQEAGVDGSRLQIPRPSLTPSLTLLTSGTAGEPKVVAHSWPSLVGSVRASQNLRSARWMSLFPLTRFAGLNTLLHALINGSVLIVPTSMVPKALTVEMGGSKPSHISGTPTMWKMLLMHMNPKDNWVASVRQITLGGEIVDQPILNSLKLHFPHARVSHIYASTEAGVCLVVSDGMAGFPVSWVSESGRKICLKIEDGELHVYQRGDRSDVVQQNCEGGWWRTDDQVEVRGDRVHFVGRKSDLLNIGGVKVSPAVVEARLCEFPGVLAARVFGQRSSITGTLMVAEILLEKHIAPDQLLRDLVAHCRATLPDYAVPRKINFIAQLPINSSGKLSRAKF